MNRITAFVAPKGGCGSSFVCANVWYSLALAGYKVLAVDFCFDKGTLDFALGFQSDYIYTFSDVIDGSCTLGEALVSTPKAENAYFLRADYDYSPIDFDKVAGVLKNTDFDFILLDITDAHSEITDDVLSMADTLICVTDAAEFSVRMCERFCSDYCAKHSYVLINKIIPSYIQAGVHLTVDEVMDLTGLNLIGLVPWIPEAEIILKQGVLNRDLSSGVSAYFDSIARRLTGEYVIANDISKVYDCFKTGKKFVLKSE